MTLDRIIVLMLTAIAVSLYVSMFVGRKGTPGHLARGLSMLVLIVSVIGINTTTLQVKWDAAWLAHLAFGSIFLAFLAAIMATGGLLYYWNRSYGSLEFNRVRQIHGRLARMSAGFLGLSLAATLVMRLLRP